MNRFFSKGVTHKFLFIIFFIVAVGGCGSSGPDSNPIAPPTDTDTDTSTASGEAAITPGTYHIYEERFPPCPRAGFNQYDITVSQESGSDRALVSVGNQFLDCTADNANKSLKCTGQLIFPDGWTCLYSVYNLMQEADASLLGETEFQARYMDSNDACSGMTDLTTRVPDHGSFIIFNSTNLTLRFLSFTECGAESSGPNEMDNQTIPPNTGMYVSNKQPACYDVWISDSRDPSSESHNGIIENHFLESAETDYIEVVMREDNELTFQQIYELPENAEIR